MFLIAPVPFGYIMYETISTEIWGHAWTPDKSEYGAAAYGFLALDIVLYFLLCLVFENANDLIKKMSKRYS
jgi:hypothetical protein